MCHAALFGSVFDASAPRPLAERYRAAVLAGKRPRRSESWYRPRAAPIDVRYSRPEPERILLKVDAGAERALTDRPNSLLPAGVVGVKGSFDAGDTVEVAGPSGRSFARGMVSIDSGGLASVAGSQTRDLPHGVVHEVIHRDDLVVLPA